MVEAKRSEPAAAFKLLRWYPLALFVVGVGLCLLSASPYVSGDEIYTLRETEAFGSNAQGLLYSIILTFFRQISDDIIWLHIPSILFGSLAAPLVWYWLRPLRGDLVAGVTALLVAISPVRIDISVFIRFHIFLLFTSVLLYWLYTRAVTANRRLTPGEIAGLVIAALLTISAQLFGVIVVGLVIAHFVFTYPQRAPLALKIGLAVGVLAVVALLGLLLIAPDTLASLYAVFAQLINSPNANVAGFAQEGPKGFSAVILAKQPFAVIENVFGTYFYPFTWWAIIPAVLAFAALALAALAAGWRERPRFMFNFLIVCGLGGQFVATAVFDPLVPPSYIASVNAQHLIWLLPLFMWAAVEGMVALRPRALAIIAAAILFGAQAVGLANSLSPTWNAPRLGEVAAALESVGDAGGLLLVDGRSDGFVRYNLDGVPLVESLWEYSAPEADAAALLAQPRQVALVVSEFQDNVRCRYSRLFSAFAPLQPVQVVRTHPYFVYVYDPAAAAPRQQVGLPPTFYHMRFQDLAIPAQIDWDGAPLTIDSLFTLPTCERDLTFTAPVNQQASRLALLSNVVARRTVPPDTVIGAVTVTTAEGQTQRFDVRMGMETASWDADTCAAPCFSALEWGKLAHFLGFSAYPRANDAFTAHIWGIDLPLSAAAEIASITVEALPDTGAEWNIWGLFALA